MKISGEQKLHLSGVRFMVDYSIQGMDEKEALECAKVTCVEETVEFPAELIPAGEIRNEIIGKVEKFVKLQEQKYLATISYAIESSSFNLIQLLNVIYGNISIAPGVRVENISLPDKLLAAFKGPRFGLGGIRNLLEVHDRPLLCTAIKPMGLNAKEFAQMAYELAMGGIDIIKDDHGLSNRGFCPFKERVDRVMEAVSKANKETGGKCIYVPNVTAPANLIFDQARYAKKAGVGGMLLMASLIGWDTMRMLADDDDLSLPIICHPSFHHIYYKSNNMGFSAQLLYGLIPRLAGADATIFLNFVGRFTMALEDCLSVITAVKKPLGNLLPSFPTVGSGLTLDNLPEYKEIYKNDIIYLMGGGLHHGESLIESCRTFRKIVSSN